MKFLEKDLNWLYASRAFMYLFIKPMPVEPEKTNDMTIKEFSDWAKRLREQPFGWHPNSPAREALDKRNRRIQKAAMDALDFCGAFTEPQNFAIAFAIREALEEHKRIEGKS